MDLSEFLLGRIAEDEAGAPWLHDSLECELAGGSRDCTCGVSARVVAECEAKRRLIYEIGEADDLVYQLHDVGDYGAVMEKELISWRLLRLLALPYADHPDYREEWRP